MAFQNYRGFPRNARVTDFAAVAAAAAVDHPWFRTWALFVDGQAQGVRDARQDTRPSRFPKSRAQCTDKLWFLSAESVGFPRPYVRAHTVYVCVCVDVVCREPHPACVGNFFLRAESLAAPASYHDETGHGSAARPVRAGELLPGLLNPRSSSLPACQCWLVRLPASQPARPTQERLHTCRSSGGRQAA